MLTYTNSPDPYEPFPRTECDCAGLGPRVRMSGIYHVCIVRRVRIARCPKTPTYRHAQPNA